MNFTMRKTRFLLHAVLIAEAALLLSTSGTGLSGETWARTYGHRCSNNAWSMCRTSDGGFAVAGFTSLFYGDVYDCWVLRLDEQGGILWEKVYRGYGDEQASCIEQTLDGGFIVAGRSDSFAVRDTNFWVLKLDRDGEIEWQKQYGGAGPELYPFITQTSDGGYTLVGLIAWGGTDYDTMLIKLDSSGEPEWTRIITSGTYGLTRLVELDDGGYVLSGTTEGQGFRDSVWLVQYDSSGRIIRKRGYEHQDRHLGTRATSIRRTPDGGLVVAGNAKVDTSLGTHDYWVLKLDSSWDVEWEKTYGGSYDDWGPEIAPTSDGGYIVAGQSMSFGLNPIPDIWILKLGADGDISWQREYTGPRNEYVWGPGSVQQTSDGGYVVAGSTNSYGEGYDDLWLLKLDPNGEIEGGCPLITETAVTPVDSSANIWEERVIYFGGGVTVSDTDAVSIEVSAVVAQQCGYEAPLFDLDVKPGSCPNPVNFRSRGVIPAALVSYVADGTSEIDPSTVLMEGVPAVRCAVEDASSPFEETESSCCGTPGPDGIDDLVCHFDKQDVVESICAGFTPPPAAGDVITIRVSALTYEGVAVEVEDCIRVQTFGCEENNTSGGGRFRSPCLRGRTEVNY